MGRYRCLVLDHDDTVVRSAETVNYPALLAGLRKKRWPKTVTYDEFNRLCFQLNFSGMCQQALGFSEEDVQEAFEFWKVYVRTHIPPAYEGFDRIFRRFREAGGIVCVSSHSGIENITRDYHRNFGFIPDAIFSWELGEEKRKPAPYSLLEIMRRYSLRPEELLMVDDMKNGYDMAKSCGVPFACAGWSHTDPMIAGFMRSNSDFYFAHVADLEAWIFDEKNT